MSSKQCAMFVTTRRSAVIRHLVPNPQCLQLYDDSCFSVVCYASSFRLLSVLEALFIRTSTRDQDLCKQKEFVTAPTPFT